MLRRRRSGLGSYLRFFGEGWHGGDAARGCGHPDPHDVPVLVRESAATLAKLANFARYILAKLAKFALK